MLPRAMQHPLTQPPSSLRRAMIMFDQSRRLSEPLRWGRREKTVVGALLACVVLIVIGLGASALTTGAPARRDCIEVTFASTLGGAIEHACGAQARKVCASPGAFRAEADELRASCRRAGFPFGG
jgi:hypothetical protein